jgi:outer membrane lipopolysaccharide assembly protein LptE/RlpB
MPSYREISTRITNFRVSRRIPSVCQARGAVKEKRSHATERRDTVAEKDERELTDDELQEQNAEQLPDREAMSLITPPIGADGIATIAPAEPEGT